MSSFSDQIKAFSRKVETQERDIFTGVVDMAHESIVEGSPVTGSPGQQVDTGALHDSWIKEYPSKDEAIISTNLAYAPNEEDNISSHGTPITQRSEVGGPHSVRLTLAGFDRIVDVVTARVVGNNSGAQS